MQHYAYDPSGSGCSSSPLFPSSRPASTSESICVILNSDLPRPFFLFGARTLYDPPCAYVYVLDVMQCAYIYIRGCLAAGRASALFQERRNSHTHTVCSWHLRLQLRRRERTHVRIQASRLESSLSFGSSGSHFQARGSKTKIYNCSTAGTSRTSICIM